MEKLHKSALLVGATGLVGRELLNILLTDSKYETVKVLTRRRVSISHPKLEQFIIDFDLLDQYQQHFQVDDVFCCLGTTIKTAGSQQAFRKVDFIYPLELARLSKACGAKKFFIISAMGADRNSKFFYNRVKGEVEEELKKLEFPTLHLFRPSLLLGKREEFRLGEKTGVLLSPILSRLMIGPLRKYKPIQARDVAMAMYQASKMPESGCFTFESSEVQSLSNNT